MANGSSIFTNQEVTFLHRLIEGEIQSRDVALKLQAIEVERRLEALNHEAARINAATTISVSAEKFNEYQKARYEFEERTNEFVATQRASSEASKDESSRMRTWVMVWVGAATLVLSGLQWVLK